MLSVEDVLNGTGAFTSAAEYLRSEDAEAVEFGLKLCAKLYIISLHETPLPAESRVLAAIMKATVVAMRKHSAEAVLQEVACDALACMHAERHGQPVAAADMAMVLAAMHTHAAESCVQESSCAALSTMTVENRAAAELAGDLGAVETVATAMAAHAGRDLQLHALTVLHNVLPLHTASRRKAAADGVDTLIISAMRAHQDEELQSVGCHALSLVWDESSHAVDVSIVVSAMRRYPLHAPLQTFGCVAMFSAVNHRPYHMDEPVVPIMPTLVLRALRLHNSVPRLCCYALTVLHALILVPGTASYLKSACVAEVVTAALAAHPGNENIAKTARLLQHALGMACGGAAALEVLPPLLGGRGGVLAPGVAAGVAEPPPPNLGALVVRLRTGGLDGESCFDCCSQLLHLISDEAGCVINASSVEAACSVGAPVALIAALRAHASDARVQGAGWHLLTKLQCTTAAWERQAVADGAVELACACLRAHVGCAEVLAAALAALDTLVHSVHGCMPVAAAQLVGKSKALQPVLAAMRNHATNEEVQARGCAALELCVLLDIRGNIRDFLNPAIPRAAVAAMCGHPMSVNVQRHACGLLLCAAICSGQPIGPIGTFADCAPELVRAGAIEATVAALRTWRRTHDNDDIAANGYLLLQQLVHEHAPHATRAIQAGAMTLEVPRYGDSGERALELQKSLREHAAAQADAAMAALLAEEEAERAASAAGASKGKSKARRKGRGDADAGGAGGHAGDAGPEAIHPAALANAVAPPDAAADEDGAAGAAMPSASAERRRRRAATKAARRTGDASAGGGSAAAAAESDGEPDAAAEAAQPLPPATAAAAHVNDALAAMTIASDTAAAQPADALPPLSSAQLIDSLFPWMRVDEPPAAAAAPAAPAALPLAAPPQTAPQLAVMAAQLAAAEAALAKAEEEVDATKCVVCMDAQRSCVILPCKHLLLCASPACAAMLGAPARCPLCRVVVSDTMQLFV